MARWIAKALAQRAIGFMPDPEYWSDLVQRKLSGSVELTYPFFLSRLDVARKHFEFFDQGHDPFETLELGAGWFPIAPIALRLMGASHVQTWDIVEHISPERLSATLQGFLRAAGDGELEARLPKVDHAVLQDIRKLAGARRPGAESLRLLGVDYRVGDLLAARLPSGCFDLIVSHAVLEYMPAPQLLAILNEFHRLLKSDGAMSHWIDLSDEYAYFDKNISRLNFLRYSDPVWRLINNPIIPLSRLRIDDIRRLFEEAGFAICREETQKLDGQEMDKLPLAREFAGRDTEDMRVLDAWIFARPGQGDASCAASAASARQE